MKTIPLTLLAILVSSTLFAQPNPARDGDWNALSATLQNTPEAEFMVRLGDIDNLGFGWGDNFDPFCERVRDAHGWPWDAPTGDVPGMDKMLVSSHANPENWKGCGGDGYSANTEISSSRPVPYVLNTEPTKGMTLTDAYLQLFIDDFQSPSICSKFTLKLNGTRFVEAEKIINYIDQSGPVGKLITLRIPEEFFPAIQSGKLSVLIDESTGASDGWAIDFVKLIVNRRRVEVCKGTVHGQVQEKEFRENIANALVTTSYGVTVKTDAEGRFTIADVPTGLEPLTATAPGYDQGGAGADVGKGDENPECLILLEKSAGKASFDGKTISSGSTVIMNNILFDQGKADLRPESKVELDKIAAFLSANPSAEIELSGHTSSEGDAAFNRSLSYRRVKSCKDYIVAKGVDTGRIIAVGRGPDAPIAPNDNEANRARNRRVEMRVLKL